MYSYNFTLLNEVLTGVIRSSVSAEAFEWLSQQAFASESTAKFNSAFVTLPRKTGKGNIQIEESSIRHIGEVRANFYISNWSVDRLARVWLLMQLKPEPKDVYFKRIDNLFLAAEVNELVALYSALPVLAHPELWSARCSEGIRNNIADVLTAIMCNNPYPSEQLNNAAWNQLVLKAFFTEKPIEQIVGLDKRANRELAFTLSDYAHERWAAHRTVNPQLWRCVGPFLDESLIDDIRKISDSDNPIEQEAAALAAYSSSYPPARDLVNSSLKDQITSGKLNWQTLAEKTKNYVLQ